jgi:hypothetical protein
MIAAVAPQAPRSTRISEIWDFTTARHTVKMARQMVADSTKLPQIPTTGAARCLFIVERTGDLSEVSLVVEDTLAVSPTDYVTLTLTNKGATATSVVMLTATAVNSTNSVGGSSLTGKVRRTFSISAGNTTRVCEGDVLEGVLTVTGTLGAVIDLPVLEVKIDTIDRRCYPRVERVAAFPAVSVAAAAANGQATIALSNATEAMMAGIDLGDQVMVPANSGWTFRARGRFATLPGAATTWFLGIISAYTNPVDSATILAGFKITGAGGVLQIQSDDNVTPRGPTNVAGVVTAGTTLTEWYIDGTDPSAVAFYYEGVLQGTLDMSGLGNQRVQWADYLFKSSSSDAPNHPLDYVEMEWNRV